MRYYSMSIDKETDINFVIDLIPKLHRDLFNLLASRSNRFFRCIIRFRLLRLMVEII